MVANPLNNLLPCEGTQAATTPRLQICTDWLAKLLRMPACFLSSSGKGGGALQVCLPSQVWANLTACRYQAECLGRQGCAQSRSARAARGQGRVGVGLWGATACSTACVLCWRAASV